jgi:hypothetical protein
MCVGYMEISHLIYKGHDHLQSLVSMEPVLLRMLMEDCILMYYGSTEEKECC